MRISCFLVAVLILTGGACQASDLALKRAVLGTGGVGYFEYEAEVSGNENLTLRAKFDQVDDILSSMVIIDPAGPALATLPGQGGAEQAFASLPFSKTDLDTMPALLAVLKGAEIRLSGPRGIEGRIVSVASETVTTKENTETTHTRVSVLANGAIEQFILEEAEGLQFKDARLAEQMEAAIRALRAAEDRSGRDITIRLAAGGKRVVRVGYVTEAPVWKVAYRMTLPKTGADKARLEGWVVLENMTGNPWKDVSVTLSSASPVTLRQALYSPYYVKRSVIAPAVGRAAQAPLDQGAHPAPDTANGEKGIQHRPDSTMPDQRKDAGGSEFYEAAISDWSGLNVGVNGGGRTIGGEIGNRFSGADRIIGGYRAEPEAPAKARQAMTESRELATEAAEDMAGASFTLSTPVTVGTGESLTVPFIDLKLPAETHSWYRGGRHPWHALSLRNDSQTSLPPGAVTVYEATDAGPLFSGDAQFPLLPTGESRLIGFAADQKVLIDSEQGSAHVLTSVKAVDGALHVESRTRQTTIYRIKNLSPDARQLTLEQPRIKDWTLAEPKTEEATLAQGVYRLRFNVEARQSREIKVVMERPLVEVIDVGELGDDRVRALMIAPEISEESRSRLAAVAEATRARDESTAEVERLEKQRMSIIEDQNRLRENLKVAPQGSDLARLYAKKMLTQEKALEEADEATRQANGRVEAAEKLVSKRVRAL